MINVVMSQSDKFFVSIVLPVVLQYTSLYRTPSTTVLKYYRSRMIPTDLEVTSWNVEHEVLNVELRAGFSQYF